MIDQVTAVCSMLHEGPSTTLNSATRLFRAQPVLAWTANRLTSATRVSSIVIVCWEDQLDAVEPIAAEQGLDVLNRGPRSANVHLAAIAAARRWSDGWRGGLLQTCDFDAGFHAASLLEILERHQGCGALVLVDPSAGLVDSELIDAMVAHAEAHAEQEIVFTPAAPGLAGALLRPVVIERLANAKTHPGKLLHYLPEHPCKDPLAGDGCTPVPMRVARTTHQFKLNSQRQIARITEAMSPLNGQLIRSRAEDLVVRLAQTPMMDLLPQEITVELTTRRATRPVYAPATHLDIQRPDIAPETVAALFKEIGGADDIRLTLAGVGDPLLHPDLPEILELAHRCGIHAVHLETDLLDAGEALIRRVANSQLDVLTVHIPALTAPTYATIMGVDAYGRVLENLRTLLIERTNRGRGTPIVVPTFTKCAANLVEMEAWYDQWLKALGSAVITGPSTFSGAIPDVGVGEMSPPRRRPCARVSSRLTVLSDGSIVLCEQDVMGRQPLGTIGNETIAAVWRERFGAAREKHARGDLAGLALCGACTEWHRP